MPVSPTVVEITSVSSTAALIRHGFVDMSTNRASQYQVAAEITAEALAVYSEPPTQIASFPSERTRSSTIVEPSVAMQIDWAVEAGSDGIRAALPSEIVPNASAVRRRYSLIVSNSTEQGSPARTVVVSRPGVAPTTE